jgi:Collagen triple helix repeat (20 copies)
VGSLFSKLKLSKGLIAGLLIGGTLGSVGVAAATSSPSTTVFYACSAKTTGLLSATSTKAPTCAKTATLVTWNSVGPQGAKGDTGTPGTNGAKGDTGDAGANGTNGAKGDTGAQGPAPYGGYYISKYPTGDCEVMYAGSGLLLDQSRSRVVYLCPF